MRIASQNVGVVVLAKTISDRVLAASASNSFLASKGNPGKLLGFQIADLQAPIVSVVPPGIGPPRTSFEILFPAGLVANDPRVRGPLSESRSFPKAFDLGFCWLTHL